MKSIGVIAGETTGILVILQVGSFRAIGIRPKSTTCLAFDHDIHY